MLARMILTTAAFSIAAAAAAQPKLEDDFAGALRGCETWILDPASHINGYDAFRAKVGLGSSMGEVANVPEPVLPPKELRVANHYWRINSTPSVGYFLVVSDQLPMCHITGGGDADLEPVIEAVLKSSAFGSGWEKVEERVRGDMVSTMFKSRKASKFTIIISRATEPGRRQDRVQLLATATLDVGQ